MMELLYTTLVIFGFLFLFSFSCKIFKGFKIFFVCFQLLLSIILLSDNFYKDQSLYEDQDYNYIQNLYFLPIKSLNKTLNENGVLKSIDFDILNSSEFSLIKTEKYSTQCLENYFIRKNEFCPITDIKLGNEKDKIYQNNITIAENEYIYYTKEDKLGKLYKSFDYYDFRVNKQDIFSIDKIARKEFNKLSNPIYDFKSYIKFCDILCNLLILMSFVYTICESLDYSKCDVIRDFNQIIQLIILILHFIRFNKFIYVKNFLFNNKDIYDIDAEKYFPNKVFNIDSFLLSVCINLFIFDFLNISFPEKPSCCEADCCNFKYDLSDDSDFKKVNFIIFIPAYTVFFVLAILDILNDKKIKRLYNKIIYNWNMNPIKSIYKGDESNYDFIWKNEYFKIERISNNNYINAFSEKDGNKICGKDNYGNKTYQDIAN